MEFSWPQSLQSRSRQNQPPGVFYKKGVLKNFTKFTESLFFNKVAGLRPETLLKKSVWHRYFHVNFAKFLRTRFLQNTSGRLLLSRHGPDKLEAFELLKSVLIYCFRMSSQRCNLNMCSSTVYLVPRFFTIVVKKLLNSSATFFIFREKEFCFELKYLDEGGGVVVVLSVRKDFTVLQISLLSVIFFIFSLLYFCYFISFFRLLNLLLLILRHFLASSSDLFATLSWCSIVRRGWLFFRLFLLEWYMHF